MKIYVIENRDVEDNYMAIEDIFEDRQLAVEASKVLGEPFWHEVVIVEHTLEYRVSEVFVVEDLYSPKYKIFEREKDAFEYMNKIGTKDRKVANYKIK